MEGMAEPGRRQAPSVKSLLLARPDRFDAMQALRLLHRIAADERLTLRLQGNTGLDCPPGGIEQVAVYPVASELHATLNYFTLAGANGPLPPPFSEEINVRLRRGDTGLRDFLDIFVDRLARLDLERARGVRPELADVLPTKSALGPALLALLGMGTPDMDRAAADSRTPPAEALLALAPLLHSEPLSAHALERAVEAWTGLPAQVRPFRGDWIPLAHDACTRLQPDRGNNRLGETATLGTAVWDPAAGITLELGPMPLARAEQLLPRRTAHRSLAELLHRLVESTIDVALTLHVVRETVLDACLPKRPVRPPRLGWTSRLAGTSPYGHDSKRPERIELPPGWIARALP